MKKADIRNQRFGMLVAKEPTEQREFGNVVWKCECDCGNIVYKATNRLSRKRMCSCGCHVAEWNKKKRKKIAKQRFGSLVAIEPTGAVTEQGQCIWRFQCDCGKIIERPISEITKKRNPTRSCGCSRAGYIGNSEHGKKYYHNLEKNYVMGTNMELIRREDTSPMKNNTSGYQGVSFISTRNVWVAAMRFQGSLVSKTCHSLEDAIIARKQMRKIRDEFVAWYDSLSEEEQGEAAAQYDNNKKFFQAFYRNKLVESGTASGQ